MAHRADGRGAACPCVVQRGRARLEAADAEVPPGPQRAGGVPVRVPGDELRTVEGAGLQRRGRGQDAPVDEGEPGVPAQGGCRSPRPDFERALHDPQVRSAVVNALLHMEFPETLHEEILDDVDLGHLVAPSPSQRDPNFKSTVLLAHENRCSFCGYSGSLRGMPVGIDAAHVQMRSHRGPDRIDNGLALCVLHHRLFDRGALGWKRRDPRQSLAGSIVLTARDCVLPALVASTRARGPNGPRQYPREPLTAGSRYLCPNR